MDKKAKVVANLRACLLSTHGGIPVSSISNDYRQLLGESIPYKELGYSTLEGLLSELPGIQLKKRGSESIVEIQAAASSEHISKLVERQKKSSGKGRRRGGGYGPLQALRKPPSSLKASGKLVRPQRSNGQAANYAYTPPPQWVPPKPLNSPKKKPQPLMEMKIIPLDVGVNLSDRSQGSMSPVTPPTPTTISPGGGARQKTPGSGRIRYNVHTSGQQPPLPSPLLISAPQTPPNQTLHSPHIHSPPIPSPPSPSSSSDLFCRNPAQKRLLQITSSKTSSESSFGASTDRNFHRSASSPLSEHHHQGNHFYNQPNNFLPPQSGPNHQHLPRQLKHVTENYGKLTAVQEGPEPYLKGSYIDKLVQLVEKYNCQRPTFVLLPRYPKGSTGFYYSCRVIVSFPETLNGSIKEIDFSTFPDEFQDPVMAKEKIAEKAYNELLVKHHNDFTIYTTKSNETVVARVTEIVAGRTQGVWTHHIEEDYERKFHEKLPDNWVSLIRNVPQLMAEKLTETAAIVRAVQTNNLNGNGDVNIIKEYINPPPTLILPSTDLWDVYVTRALNSGKIWIRFVGEEFSDLFEPMANAMETYYNNQCYGRMRRPLLERERYYVLVSPEYCSRVRLLNFIPNSDFATVSLIDHGDVDNVTLSNLRPLDARFAELPAQAIECCLYGLEQYKNNAALTQLLTEQVENKVLVGEVVSYAPIKLILYDTSGENHINLNNYFSEAMELIESKPALMESKSIYEACLTCVSDNGFIYLQFPSKALSYIEESLSGMTAEKSKAVMNKSSLQHDKIYLMMNPELKRFVRVRVLGQIQDMVDVEMIDYGLVVSTPFGHLLDPEEVTEYLLCVIPPQCVRAQLKDIPPIDFQKKEVVSAFNALVKTNEKILVKLDNLKNNLDGDSSKSSASSTGSNTDDETPIVELFKRIQPENLLISVNYTLRVNNADLFDEHEDLIQALQRVEIKSELKQAKIPKINEQYFDVFVVSAANPFNFIVQPLEYRAAFKDLLFLMGQYYSVSNQGRPFNDIKVGAYCTASIARLNGWYRGHIDKIVSSQDVSFYACDIGELHVINSRSLRILEQQFMDVPALAFNAKLTSIAPLHGDWLVEDTRRFQELTENKSFVSVIESKTISPNSDKPLLGLKLTDTSSPADIDIAHLFVVERRAKYI